MKKLLKIIFYPLITVFTFLTLYLVSTFVLSRIPVNSKQKEQSEVNIYILSNGVHTDLVLPIKSQRINWGTIVKYEDTVSGDSLANYIAFGWGDKGFYLDTPEWSQLKPKVALNAALGLSTSAIHATFYKKLEENEDCIKLKISYEQYNKLVNFIWGSFQKDNFGNPIFIKTNAVYGDNDSFYEGVGSYSLFHTCNTWANNGLKACDQKAALWTAFDSGIFYHYNK